MSVLQALVDELCGETAFLNPDLGLFLDIHPQESIGERTDETCGFSLCEMEHA
jgi:hypothetical protein